ncbi:MAG: PP0621 family protein [Thermoanaerobaculales bacterium]
MQRILLWVVVLLVVWRVLSAIGWRQAGMAPGADSFSRFSPEARRRRRQRAGVRGGAEELVECPACGTFVPVGRALPSGGGRLYCSETCRRAGADASHDDGG